MSNCPISLILNTNKTRFVLKDLTQYTVIIAEDDKFSQMLLEAYLNETGLNIIYVSDGKEVIEYLEKGTKIDLVLTDLKMPEVNGYEISKQIKEKFKNIPIIVQTASIFSENFLINNPDIFDDYILKPYTKEEVINKILKVLSQSA